VILNNSSIIIQQKFLVELGLTEIPNVAAPNLDRPVGQSAAPTTSLAASEERSRVGEQKLSIYKKYFQDRFIDETKQYYKTESSNFIQNNSVVAYMKKVDHIYSNYSIYVICSSSKVEVRLSEECNRVNLYLDKSTQDPLAKACEDVLIKVYFIDLCLVVYL
jgi:hypothetical protein